MSIEGENESQSPFSRPGFIAAAVVVAVIVVLGIVIAIVNATQDNEPEAAPPPSATPTSSGAPTTNPSAAAGGASVCGLDGVEAERARLTSPPEVDQWDYQGTTAYPVSQEHGPGATGDDGRFHYCFQHTPEGALFAAAYALAVGSDQAVAPQWIEYFAAPGPYRDQLTSDPSAPGGDADSGADSTRMNIAGFRLLAYDGTAARIDLGVTGASQGTPFSASVVYELVWADGDWKVDTNTPEPFNFAVIPDLSGYIQWGNE